MKPVTFKAADGQLLAGHIFEAAEEPLGVVIISGATGVHQQVYFNFAKYLAASGFTAITYDYRGIGLSAPEKLRNFQASMRDWGRLDFPAVTDHVLTHYSGKKVFVVGHSVGALVIGMNPDAHLLSGMVFVATQDAYIGNLKPKIALSALLGFGLAVPLLTALKGFFPAPWFGLGAALPGGAAYDWRTLILHPKSTAKLYTSAQVKYARQLNQKTLVITADDDRWVTERGIDGLLKNVYPSLQKSLTTLKSADSPNKNIGHINFFRQYNAPLWSVVLNWLHKQTENGTHR